MVFSRVRIKIPHSAEVLAGDSPYGDPATQNQKKCGWQHNSLFLARLLGISLAINLVFILNHWIDILNFYSVIFSSVFTLFIFWMWDKYKKC